MQGHRLAEPRRPLVAERRAAVEHVQRGVERPLRIVLVGDRRAEDRQDGIAHELLHEAVVARDRLGERLEQRILERAHLLGIEPLGQRGEAGDVGEEDGHLPAVHLRVAGIRPSPRPGRRRTPRRTAPGTEREISLARESRTQGRAPAAAARTAGRR